jgi:chorismate lyase
VFRTKGPFWGRHYIFWHGGKPMTVVYEVFNPRLENALGPAKPPAR